MGETKTTYSIWQIRDAVRNLQYSSEKEIRKNVELEFSRSIEENAELACDLSAYKSKLDEVNALEKKYKVRYPSDYHSDRLRYKIKEDRCEAALVKARDQFRTIQDRLVKIRNADKALEFIKLCGIELPEKVVEPAVQIPVDPDFIRSILPKNPALPAGSEEK